MNTDFDLLNLFLLQKLSNSDSLAFELSSDCSLGEVKNKVGIAFLGSPFTFVFFRFVYKIILSKPSLMSLTLGRILDLECLPSINHTFFSSIWISSTVKKYCPPK